LVIASPAIENIMQLFKNNTVSYCGVATDTSSHNAVKVFPVVISGVPRNIFRGGGSTNSVEGRGQREWGSGDVAP